MLTAEVEVKKPSPTYIQNKIPYIDVLRGIAVLGVVMVHIGVHTLDGVFLTVTTLGAKGVQLFYFVSAFTLFLSWKNTSKKKENINLNFFIRRLFRIAPLYYLGIIFYGIVLPLYWHNNVDFVGVILNALFLHGFS